MRTHIETALRADVLHVRLVPPEGKPPSLDEQVLEELRAVTIAAEACPPLLLVLESAAPKYFCVGANIEALRRTTVETMGAWVSGGHEVFNRLEALPCPTVARVEGYALGGGLELAMACDFIYASTSARLGQPEARLGFIPGWGGCRRLAERVGLPVAKRLFFTAAVIDAVQAQALRLVDFTGSGDELDAALAELADNCRSCSRSAIAAFKRLVTAEQAGARQRNLAAESAESRECLLDPDTPARVAAFLNRKKTPSA